jgi:sec-independent protein translocase protein TatC
MGDQSVLAAAEVQGMIGMSLTEHLEELRSRIIKALYGLAVAFVLSLSFAGQLWDVIKAPATEALQHLGVNPPRLAVHTPMEAFTVIWVELPLLCSVFLASPWIVYQLWAFISPGLFKRERRLAVPFVLTTGGLFLVGGLFAYFLAFRFGLEFLFGIATGNDVQPVISISDYFNLFCNVTLGAGLVFELPVLIFLLTLLHVASPRFLLRHSRYAIIIIVAAAAVLTPTPDYFNLMLVAVPMCVLYFLGVFLSYLLVLRREGNRLPWKAVTLSLVLVLFLTVTAYALVTYLHLHLARQWPYLIH